MSSLFKASSIGLALGLVIAGGASAEAVAKAPSAKSSCFFINQWEGWKSPGPNVIYLRVRGRDIYKVELSGGSDQLSWSSYHLVSRSRGTSVCTALDLDLALSDGHGFYQPLIVRSLVKLDPEEAAAIPKKYQP
jgi:hypothetical protein